jgi:hypothetical protein
MRLLSARAQWHGRRARCFGNQRRVQDASAIALTTAPSNGASAEASESLGCVPHMSAIWAVRVQVDRDACDLGVPEHSCGSILDQGASTLCSNRQSMTEAAQYHPLSSMTAML